MEMNCRLADMSASGGGSPKGPGELLPLVCKGAERKGIPTNINSRAGKENTHTLLHGSVVCSIYAVRRTVDADTATCTGHQRDGKC